jgi:Rrf2 family iron-sulfur cluster assembly transcriptional regulator
MIDLGLRHEKGPVTLSAISQRQKISLSYLEQLFGRLRRHELVESMRGPGGGYRLARSSKDITVADIIYAVDEPLDATQCGGKQNCHEDQVCMTHELWASLNRHMVDCKTWSMSKSKRPMAWLKAVLLGTCFFVKSETPRPCLSCATR